MTKELLHITANLSGMVRHDQLEGRDHLVAPMVMLLEGVHSGSNGPLFYSKKEIGQHPETWNGKPIVIYHPMVNGMGVSACSPEVFNSRKCGVVMNSTFQKKDKALKAEAWLDVERLEAVDDRVMSALEADEPMELSTGLFADYDLTEGTWNNEEYLGSVHNCRPDHLALLPDKIGACSLAKGAGLLVNKADNKKRIEWILSETMKEMGGLTDNEMSHSNLRDALNGAMTIKYGDAKGIWNGWIEDVYEDFIIYFFDGKLHRLDYSATDTMVELENVPPREVVRVTEYRTTDGAFVGNEPAAEDGDPSVKEKDMDRKELVDNLIANEVNEWSDDDREFLMNATDAQFEKMAAEVTVEAPAVNVVTPEVTPAPAPVQNAVVVGAASIAPKAVTANEYVQNAPAEIRDMLNAGLSSHNADRQRVIANITANDKNIFTPEQLGGKDLQELKALEALAYQAPAQLPAGQKANYAGANAPGGAPVQNTQEHLDLPTWNAGD